MRRDDLQCHESGHLWAGKQTYTKQLHMNYGLHEMDMKLATEIYQSIYNFSLKGHTH